jgi:hypothetical protein
MGTPVEIIKIMFGGKAKYEKALGLEHEVYNTEQKA